MEKRGINFINAARRAWPLSFLMAATATVFDKVVLRESHSWPRDFGVWLVCFFIGWLIVFLREQRLEKADSPDEHP